MTAARVAAPVLTAMAALPIITYSVTFSQAEANDEVISALEDARPRSTDDTVPWRSGNTGCV